MSYHLDIIVDKSTFQLLNYQELLKLSQYYKHNVTPVLVMEIIGDLKKEAKGNKVPEDVVKDFAKKLFPTEITVNHHFEGLVKGELLGQPVSLDGRPHVGVAKVVKSETGMRGFLVEQTEEEKMLYKWRDGKFTEADHHLSAMWRSSTTQEDLLENLQKTLTGTYGTLKLKSFDELNESVCKIADDPAKQDQHLANLIKGYGLSPEEGLQIFYKWQAARRPAMKEFAPYSYHCMKVDLFLILGLQSHLIGPRPTNRVDLEYLYYLPFCTVFTSNDNIHKKVAPYLIRPNQKFIVGENLKSDLKQIVGYLDAGGLETKRKHKNEPPVIQESLTFQLWKEFYGYPEGFDLHKRDDPKDKAYVKKKMEEFERAIQGENIPWDGNSGEPEFIIKQSWLSKDDPCICGSGEPFIKCCPDKFYEAARKHFEKLKKNV